jgi:NADH-quinone oxidoreductase subunit H
MSAVIVTLFLGGPAGPSFGLTGWVADYVLPFTWFFLKLVVFLFMFVMFRTTLPRFRYDQLMDLGWKLLIPLSLGWFLVLVATKVADVENWNQAIVVPLAIVALGIGGALLLKSVRTAQGRRIAQEEAAPT